MSAEALSITVEDQPNCRKTLRIALPPSRVTAQRSKVVSDYRNHANIPGYRKGKAPIPIVERQFRKDIEEELKRSLVINGCREAIAEQKINVIAIGDAEDVIYGPDHSLSFSTTVVVSPEFEVPDYSALTVKVVSETVEPQEVEDFLNRIREQMAEFRDAETRTAVAEGDFAVVDLDATVDGVAIAEAAPNGGAYFGPKKAMWLKIDPKIFLPDFAPQLIGANIGESREISHVFAEDFSNEALAGKTAVFTVAITGLKEKVLPELTDELVAKFVNEEGVTVEKFRTDLENVLLSRKKQSNLESKANQVVSQLIGGVDFEVPDLMVRTETRRVADEMVREGKQMGMTDEQLQGSRQEIFGRAVGTARNRIKARFILNKIAAAEGVTVSDEDVEGQIENIAERSETTPEKVFQQLQKNGTLDGLREDLLFGKTLDLLISRAATIEVAALPEPDEMAAGEGGEAADEEKSDESAAAPAA